MGKLREQKHSGLFPPVRQEHYAAKTGHTRQGKVRVVLPCHTSSQSQRGKYLLPQAMLTSMHSHNNPLSTNRINTAAEAMSLPCLARSS